MSSTHLIAWHLACGGAAEVVGGEPLRGVPDRIVEVDGVPLMIPHGRRAAPGVRLTGPDGGVTFVACRERESAAELLRGAEGVIARELRA